RRGPRDPPRYPSDRSGHARRREARRRHVAEAARSRDLRHRLLVPGGAEGSGAHSRAAVGGALHRRRRSRDHRVYRRWQRARSSKRRAEDTIAKIRAGFPAAGVEMKAPTATADHWQATIVSQAFDGKSLLQRHRMVMAALVEEMKGPIHALT